MTVIQTGTIAAVAIAFARFSGVLLPAVREDNYIVRPLLVLPHYAFSLSTAQLMALAIILLIAFLNCRGVQWGKVVQNVFTVAKLFGMLALLVVGAIAWFMHPHMLHENFVSAWRPSNVTPVSGLQATSFLGIVVALCVSQTGSLFSADSWHDITFVAGEVRNPRRNFPLALALGTALVIVLYLLCNVCYLAVLPLHDIQTAPGDRVATLMVDRIMPGAGVVALSILIMVSTFSTVNALTLAGAAHATQWRKTISSSAAPGSSTRRGSRAGRW